MGLSTIKHDREFILQLAREFFDSDMKEKLGSFKKFDVYGWEIWLQVEFYLFLKQHNLVKSVDREIRCSLDGRKNPTKRFAVLDFMIHEKRKQSSIPLEIKQHMSAKSCLTSMLKDVKKFGQIKYSGINTSRNLWCLGVHLGPQLENSQEYCEYEITSEQIGNTEYYFTLI